MKICVLERGLVLVGNLEKDGEEFVLTNAYIIRGCGTTEDLGKLAMKGPLPETKLEKTPLVRFNKCQMIFCISCEESKWKLT